MRYSSCIFLKIRVTLTSAQQHVSYSSKSIPKNLKKPTPVKVHILHKDQIPIWMHDFIEKVTNVPGHDHCGFRAVAVLRNLIVDDHQIVRYNLYKELVGV